MCVKCLSIMYHVFLPTQHVTNDEEVSENITEWLIYGKEESLLLQSRSEVHENFAHPNQPISILDSIVSVQGHSHHSSSLVLT